MVLLKKSMKRVIFPSGSSTEVKLPRRMTFRARIESHLGASRAETAADGAGGNIEIGDEGGGAVADVLELRALGTTGTHRLCRCDPLERLHTGDLVDAAGLDPGGRTMASRRWRCFVNTVTGAAAQPDMASRREQKKVNLFRRMHYLVKQRYKISTLGHKNAV
jgi:hypothetical protein